jgi:hypothetical protein
MAKKKRIKYLAADGAQYDDLDAQSIGEMAEQLAKKNKLTSAKLVTPAMLVAAANPARSPIHDLFEWDDEKAAGHYRIKQAQNLLNHLEIEVVIGGKLVQMKAFHHVSVEVNEDEMVGGYSHASTVSLDVELSEQVVDKAKQQLIRWKERYAQYRSVFSGVMAEIEAL